MQQARRTLSPPTMQCVTVAVMGGYDILRGMQFPRKSHLGGIRFPRVCDPGGDTLSCYSGHMCIHMSFI